MNEVRLSSFLRRDLRDKPAALLSDPDTPPLLAAAAAIIAGEPRRALAMVDSVDGEARAAPAWVAIRALAIALEVNWWPGDVGAVLLGDTPDIEQPGVVPTGDDRTDLLHAVMSEIQPQLLSIRTLIRASVRVDPVRGAEAARYLSQQTFAFLKAAAQVDVSMAASVAIELADLYRLGGLAAEAGKYLAWARQAYTSLDDAAGRARCLLVEADWLITPATFTETLGFDLEDLNYARPVPAAEAAEGARGRYREARALFRAARAVRGEAAAELREAYLDSLAGRPGRAERRLRAAARRCRQSGDGAMAHLADTHATLAAIAAGRLSASRPGPAAGIEQWVNTVGSGSYGRGLGRLVHAAGHAWRVAGDIERARVTLTLAADLASGFTQREVLTELGDLFQAINSVGPAIASYQRALSGRLAEVSGADAPGSIEPMTWLEIGELVVSMFKLHMSARDADDLARTAALATALLGRAPGGISARPAGSDLLELLEREREELAKLSADRMTAAPGSQPAGDFEDRALTLAAEALASLVSQADVLVPFYQARQHQHEGDDADAAALFATALRRAGDQGAAGRSLQALVLGALGRHNEAQTVVANLLRDAPGIDPDEVVSLWASSRAYGKAVAIMKNLPPNAMPGWRDLTQRGTICAGADDIDAAAGYLARASAAFEAWVAGVSRDAFRISIADDGTARELYTVAASVALRQRRTGDAFALTDRLRSLALNELLRDVADRGHEQPTQSATIRRWSQASAEWTGAYDLLAAAGNSGDIERIERAQTRLDTAQANLETAEKHLETVLPRRLLGGRRTSTPPVALEQIQPLIPDDGVLVEYLVGWDRILIWAVDRHQAAASEMAFDTPRLSGMVRRFHRYCARHRVTADALDDAETLTRLLLDPVAGPIRDHRRLVIVPSGPLHLMPFHALPFDGAYLGTTRVASVLPSASVLPYAIGRSRPAIDRGALVVGNPAYAPGRGLRQLPGTLVEARQVASRFNVTALVGSEASEERVGKAAEHAAVIHLATHGMVSAIAPTTSSVALADSGELTVADLMGLAIDADLVVLSACDTGRGDATLGGDVVGLVRGLLAAGARNAVVSLWPVDDEATCVLMDAFAQQLRTGRTIADALAAAQRSIRTLDAAGRSAAFSALAQATGTRLSAGQQRAVRDTLLEDPGHADDTHPYWWAPFVHVGV